MLRELYLNEKIFVEYLLCARHGAGATEICETWPWPWGACVQ